MLQRIAFHTNWTQITQHMRPASRYGLNMVNRLKVPRTQPALKAEHRHTQLKICRRKWNNRNIRILPQYSSFMIGYKGRIAIISLLGIEASAFPPLGSLPGLAPKRPLRLLNLIGKIDRVICDPRISATLVTAIVFVLLDPDEFTTAPAAYTRRTHLVRTPNLHTFLMHWTY